MLTQLLAKGCLRCFRYLDLCAGAAGRGQTAPQLAVRGIAVPSRGFLGPLVSVMHPGLYYVVVDRNNAC
jgi:hypothetical protein